MNKVLKDVIGTSLYILFVLLLTYLLLNYVGQRTVVIGSSMESTLSDGDNLIVDKISYRFSDIERFDIVVFPYEDEKNSFFIKRVIGMPGETVYIAENGDIYINDQLLEESYGREVIRPETRGRAAEPVKLGEDEYFVMGDNRNNSMDGRDPRIGNISKDRIEGRAWVRIFPFDRISMLNQNRKEAKKQQKLQANSLMELPTVMMTKGQP